MGCSAGTIEKTSEPVMKRTEEPATLLASATTGKSENDGQLRWNASRVFDLAQKDCAGRLDMKNFSYIRSSRLMADTLCNNEQAARVMQRESCSAERCTMEADLPDAASRSEWLSYFQKLAEERNDDVANQVLGLYEKEIEKITCIKRNFGLNSVEVLSDWPLRSEVLRVFHLADKNQDGKLDLGELRDVRNNPDMAEAMMRILDTDLDGTLNEEEWMNYFYKLFLKNEKTAAAILKLYEKQVKAPKTITIKKASTWEVIDGQQSTKWPLSSQPLAGPVAI